MLYVSTSFTVMYSMLYIFLSALLIMPSVIYSYAVLSFLHIPFLSPLKGNCMYAETSFIWFMLIVTVLPKKK